MSSPIISVEHLSKKYRITHQGQRQQYATLRDVLAAKSKNMLARFKPGKTGDSNGLSTRSTNEDFWALKDVSFEVQQGEVLGIIGRNGAGKSTLLKILSRITDPTEGRVTIRGRVASLLEVGTGFHQELTGRENVFLNGAILGMSRAEIKRKFDEIVDFAGVEKFLDTPVKRYSSGMYVRLAFAVAAHLEPEILIVDEVLAVGDAEFQKKCLGKMKDVSTNEGRTVLFVSHNLTAVRALCKTGILLQRGHLLFRGSANETIEHYLSAGSDKSGRWVRTGGSTDGIHFESAYLLDSSNNPKGEFDFADRIRLRLTATVSKRFDDVQIAVRVSNEEGFPVFTTCNTDEMQQYVPLRAGLLNYSIEFPSAFLSPGRYSLIIAAHTPKQRQYDIIDNEISFTIHDTGRYMIAMDDDRLGVVNPLIRWQSQ